MEGNPGRILPLDSRELSAAKSTAIQGMIPAESTRDGCRGMHPPMSQNHICRDARLVRPQKYHLTINLSHRRTNRAFLH